MRLARRLRRAPDAAAPPLAGDDAATAMPAVTVPEATVPEATVPEATEPAATSGLPLMPLGLGRAVAAAGDRGAGRRPPLRLISFIIVVVLPIAGASVYLFLVAADQYVAEFRFTLSAVGSPRADPLSFLLGSDPVQSPPRMDSQLLVQYIASRAIVDDVGKSLDLRRLFAPPRADWWARLPQGASIEELVRYWQGQVDPFYDPSDGTVTVRVRAFAPQDAVRLARAISAACEHVVNALSQRARRDALRDARAEAVRAQRRLSGVLADIRRFRNRNGLIDPARAAATNGALAARLREERLRAKSELSTLKTYMRDNAPSIRVLTARLKSLDSEQRTLAAQMTSPHATGDASGHARADAALSGVLGAYDELESRRKFAEIAYQHALLALDEARADADRQHVFIASFVPPSLPQEALYPRRWRTLGTVALFAFAAWGIGGLVVQSVRDHLS